MGAITGVLLAAAVTAAIISFGRRRLVRARLRRAARARAGASPEGAIYIRSYAEMDGHLAGRWCHCGGYLERTGEGTRQGGDRRYRVVQLRCQECEERAAAYFDVTDLLH
jgi:hypothetical protein